MYGRVGVVCLVPLSRGGPPCQQISSKSPPLGVNCLSLDDCIEVKRVWENVCLCPGVADEPLGVELLCYPHSLFGTDPQLARGQLLKFLSKEKSRRY